MNEFHYSCEFAGGARATLTLSLGGMSCVWTPDIPQLKGQRRRRFLATYRVWRDECVADYAKKIGGRVLVIEL